ncbi:hypothetical protein ABDJ34_08390 [Finegoldia dalianensis]|uniref:Transposase n=1 Tax=Finegoldia dalianensis TaxID=3145239 RepID=A0ABW9KEW4_9FIRM
MTILYKTNTNKNGNSYHVAINHDNKTYNENTFTSDLTIFVKLKELKQLKALAVNNGYINIG